MKKLGLLYFACLIFSASINSCFAQNSFPTRSPDGNFEVIKTEKQVGEPVEIQLFVKNRKTKTKKKICELQTYDWPDPKWFWTSDSRLLISENGLQDSLYGRGVLIFDLKKFQIIQQIPGLLLNFDPKNEVVFFYNSTPQSQQVWFFDLKNPDLLKMVEVQIQPDYIETPVVKFDSTERKGRAWFPGLCPDFSDFEKWIAFNY